MSADVLHLPVLSPRPAEPEAVAGDAGALGRYRFSAGDLSALCVKLAEAAEDVRTAARALQEQHQAMRLALEAIDRIDETGDAALQRLMTLQARHAEGLPSARTSMDDDVVAPRREVERLLRPLGVASAAAVAVNASITASSMALTEASLRVMSAGERYLEALRLSPGARPAAGRATQGPVS